MEGEISTWSDVRCGVPKGSVLGSLLFVNFINDMPQSLKSACLMFADDAKVYRSITSTEDCDSLQIDISNMCEWSRKWQLPFNETKCKCIYFGRSNPKVNYEMNNHTLENVSDESALGVIIDDSLRFHK